MEAVPLAWYFYIALCQSGAEVTWPLGGRGLGSYWRRDDDAVLVNDDVHELKRSVSDGRLGEANVICQEIDLAQK